MTDYIEKFKNWLVWKFNNPYGLNWPSGQCPVQIEGTLPTGEHYYFRARGSRWYIDICQSEQDWWLNKILFKYTDNYGETFEAGWMSKREAIKFATLGIKKYYQHLSKG